MIKVNIEKVIEIVTPTLMYLLDQCKYSGGRKKLISVCPFCKGGRSRERAFDISIPTNTSPRFLYNCHRASCRQKGFITQDFMRMIGSNVFEVNVQINKLNSISSGNRKYRDKSYRDIVNFVSPNNDLSRLKLEYLNRRLGLNLSFNDLRTLKIHTDMNSLYHYNNIKYPEGKRKYYKSISDHGIAFISTYNDFINVRRVVDNKYIKRYTIIELEEDSDNDIKFKSYSIPTKVDLLATEPVEIIMTEGSFDILSVYYNIENGIENSLNRIFVSVSGASYENILTHFIRKYGLLNIVIKIYSDQGIPLSDYENLYRKIKKYVIDSQCIVYYNVKSKDFGVPIDSIEIETNYIR